MHDPKHPLVVDFIATILELCGNPSIAVAGKFQSYLLNFVPQNIVFVIHSGDCLLFYFAIYGSCCDIHLEPSRMGDGQLKAARKSVFNNHVPSPSAGFSLSSRNFF